MGWILGLKTLLGLFGIWVSMGVSSILADFLLIYYLYKTDIELTIKEISSKWKNSDDKKTKEL